MTNTLWSNLFKAVSAQDCLTIKNPVIQAIMNDLRTAPSAGWVLGQYFYLVANIVQFLVTAMARIPNQAVKNELRRNIEEELGSRNNDVSHQEMLEFLLKKELGIDARDFISNCTARFISELMLSFHTRSPHFVAGMIYALEATAKPELIVVAHIINFAAQPQVIDIVKLTDESTANDSTLEGFIAMHTKDFEVGHESGLRETLEDFIATDTVEFCKGFDLVLCVMQIWWDNLAQEVK